MQWICTTIKLSLLGVLLALTACQPITKIDRPQLVYTPTDVDFEKFIPLKNPEGISSDWEKEYKIGVLHAREQDFYRAITALKRALFLMPAHSSFKMNIYYNIGLCYYFGKKYDFAIENLEKIQSSKNWDYYTDYLTILHDCYLKISQDDKADLILEKLLKINPALGKKISLYTPLTKGNLKSLQASIDPSINTWANEIKKKWKSPRTAGVLNAVLPGAGYLYLDQKSTAITAFIINSLFISATYRLFNRKHIALGIVTGSLELGWYVGGISGARESAALYNRQIYDKEASHMMKSRNLFPALMINYAF